jgi:hypothetical protein
MEQKYGVPVQGTDCVYNTGTVDVLADAGATNRYHVDRIIIGHYTKFDPVWVSVTDGTMVFIPRFLAKDGNRFSWVFDFGPKGWVSAINAPITLVVEDPQGGQSWLLCVTCCTVIARNANATL